jgi:hypothetical protein
MFGQKKGQKGTSKEVMKLLVGCPTKRVDSCCKCAKKWGFCVALKINNFKTIQYRCVFILGSWKKLYYVGS